MKKALFIIIVLICIIFVIPKNKSIAVTTSNIRQQINTTNNQIETLNQQIKLYQQQISKTSEQKNTLTRLIRRLALTRNKLVKEKEKTQKKITVVNLTIKNLSSDINTQQEAIESSKKLLSELIVTLYINDNTPIIEKFVLQGNLANISSEYNDIISINEKIRQYLKKVKIQKSYSILSKNEKEIEQKKLNSFNQTLYLQQKAIEITKSQKNKILINTKNREYNYKKLLAEQQKKYNAFKKDLLNYEAQLKFILNPNSLPKEGSEVLSWPLKNIFITQLFGVTSASRRLYRSGSHSGVDFRASIGTKVMAMASGVVIDTGNTDIYCKNASFGKWVFIKYDNGLSSTFGHLLVISAKAGQRVKAGDIVALSGNTGHTTGPHLHVSVYASGGVSVRKVPSLTCRGKDFIMPIASINSYLNPMLYLPKIAKNKIK